MEQNRHAKKKIIFPDKKARVGVGEYKYDILKQAISEFLNIEWLIIQGDSREKNLIIGRQCFCFFCYALFEDKNLVDIGEYVGYTDHSSPLHAAQTFSDRLQTKEKEIVSIYKYVIKKVTEPSLTKYPAYIHLLRVRVKALSVMYDEDFSFYYEKKISEVDSLITSEYIDILTANKALQIISNEIDIYFSKIK